MWSLFVAWAFLIPEMPHFLKGLQNVAQTCRKGSALGSCWGAKQHGHLRPRAAGGSPATPEGQDHGAAPPPGRISTSTAGSACSASTNTATTRGSPCLYKMQKDRRKKLKRYWEKITVLYLLETDHLMPPNHNWETWNHERCWEEKWFMTPHKSGIFRHWMFEHFVYL